MNYMSQILVELIKLANLIVLLMRAFLPLQCAADYGYAQDERTYLPKEQTTKCGCGFLYENVSFAYRMPEMAITDIDFFLYRSMEPWNLLANRSGKSTVLHLLNHMYDLQPEERCMFTEKMCSRMIQKELTKWLAWYHRKAFLFHGKYPG